MVNLQASYKMEAARGIKVLLVDDNEHLRPLMKRLLEAQGNMVFEAANGVEAMSFLHAAGVDLVITDIIMPEKAGIETIVEIRRKYPHIRILAISGGGWMEPEAYLETAREMGAHETLAKPFSREAFIDAVESAMSRDIP